MARVGRHLMLAVIVVAVAAARGQGAGGSAAMEICATEIEGAKAATADIATELAALQKAPPKPAPEETVKAGIRPDKLVAQARQDQVWLQALVQQAEAQYKAAQNARNEAERQVALKDALLKTASAQHLATSIRTGIDLVKGDHAPQSTAPTTPQTAPRSGRLFKSDDFLEQLTSYQQLKLANERSVIGAGSRPTRAAAWARAAFEGSTPTPGGILFSSALTSELLRNLHVRAVSFDATRGEIVVAGERSERPLDPDLLATGLRLGLEREQPFFSLDPVVPEIWVEEWDRLHGFLRSRLDEHPYLLQGYRCRSASRTIPWSLLADPGEGRRRVERWCQGEGGPPDLASLRGPAERLKATAIRSQAFDGHTYHFGTVEELDPVLRAEIEREFRIQERLVFRPTWLRETRVGEVLYQADVTLKELWMPFSQAGGRASRVIGVPGSIAFKVFHDESEGPYLETRSRRWWFMPGASVAADGNFLDLSQLEPRLHIVAQERGKDVKAAISSWATSVRDDVNRRFPAYARAIVEWDELAEIFRAYVLALWLKEKAPEVAQRLLHELPDPRSPSRPLPAIHRPLVVIAHREPTIQQTGGSFRWQGYPPGIRKGGVSFSKADVLWTSPAHTSASLRAAVRGEPTTGFQIVRLRLTPDPPALPPALADAWVASPRSMVEDLKSRYDSWRQALEQRQGGLIGRTRAAVGWRVLLVLVPMCALVVAVTGRWRIG